MKASRSRWHAEVFGLTVPRCPGGDTEPGLPANPRSVSAIDRWENEGGKISTRGPAKLTNLIIKDDRHGQRAKEIKQGNPQA